MVKPIFVYFIISNIPAVTANRGRISALTTEGFGRAPNPVTNYPLTTGREWPITAWRNRTRLAN